MVKTLFLCLLSLVACPLFAGETNELALAKAALRDGLWRVARTHAARAEGDEAKLIVLESHAREGDWRGLLAAFDAMGYPTGEGFAYYRALALYKAGSHASASNLLSDVTFKDAGYGRPAARLRAELALESGGVSEAVRILARDGGDDVETKLMLASLFQREGDAPASARLWGEVAAETNLTDRARAEAAFGLRDAARLREVIASTPGAATRRFASLKLGELLLADAATLSEGERIIRSVVRDQPDAEGAREAFSKLASAQLEQGNFTGAAQTYADALEIWSDATKDAALHFGRGCALLGLRRYEEAVQAFRQAEELTSDAEQKSFAAVKIGDALAHAGRMKESTAAYQRVRETYPDTQGAARVADVIRLREKEDEGRRLYGAFKFDEARKLFAEVAREDAACREQLAFLQVLCEYGAGDDNAAETHARALAEQAHEITVRAAATLWLAKFSYNRQRWREAERLFAAYAEMLPAASEAPEALAWSARSALANNDFAGVIATATKLVSNYPDSPLRAAGLLAQGEALIELARFDEAALVLDRVALVTGLADADRLRARILRADALFAMGADNPARYQTALDAYSAIRTGEKLSPGDELSLSFKVAKTLEKLRRLDEAIDVYYTQIVLAYRTGRLAGVRYDDAARATFARAGFRLAEIFEGLGQQRQAVHVLDLVRTSDVAAASEAQNRINRITQKGLFP